MGLFICFKKDKYKNDLHSVIEENLRTRYGYTQITQEQFNRIIKMIMAERNDRGETFCKSKDENGNPQGIDTATLGGHTIGEDTILILSKRDNFDEIESVDDIRAVLVFNYEEQDDDDKKYELDVHVLCSNQLTKSGGARTLLTNLIDVSRENGIKLISLNSSDTAIEYYQRFGFTLVNPRFPTFMALQLGGKRMVRLVLKLKSTFKKSGAKSRKNKKLKSTFKKSGAKSRKLKPTFYNKIKKSRAKYKN
jgi:hypothetical protein